MTVCFAGCCSESFARHWYLGLLSQAFLSDFEQVLGFVQPFQLFRFFSRSVSISECSCILRLQCPAHVILSIRALRISNHEFFETEPLGPLGLRGLHLIHLMSSFTADSHVHRLDLGCMSEDIPDHFFLLKIVRYSQVEKHIFVDAEDKAAMMS